MHDQWANLVLAGKSANLLVVVAFVSEQDIDGLEVACGH